MLKIKTVNENALLEEAIGFLKERFNTEVSVYGEKDTKRYDPKCRARDGYALPTSNIHRISLTAYHVPSSSMIENMSNNGSI